MKKKETTFISPEEEGGNLPGLPTGCTLAYSLHVFK
jgi:hypothetical protein